jgi:RNA polymerase sigma-70 factor (ECF subfamily)
MILFLMADNDDDREYMERLYSKYYGFMMSTALKYVKEKFDAQDIVNSSVFRIYRNIDRIRELGESREMVCMLYIIKSESLDYIRKNNRISTHEIYSYDGILQEDITESAENKYFEQNNVKYDKLYTYVEKLCGRDRDLLMYKYFLEYSDKEIGNVMGIPYRNVGTYITRAKRKLLNYMQEP